MRIAITGATGFIGQHLLRHYLDAGAESDKSRVDLAFFDTVATR